MLRRERKKLLLILLVIGAIVIILVRFHNNNNNRNEYQVAANAKGLNVAVWKDLCGSDMRSLKEFPLFPHAPVLRLKAKRFQMHFTREFENFGLRMYGFLTPDESSSYNFHLESSGSSELWLSLDSNPENSKLIANITSGTSLNRAREQDSISLLAGKRYYTEILLKHGHHHWWNDNFLHLKWRSSKWKDELRDIPSNLLSAFEYDMTSKPFDGVKSYSAMIQPMPSEVNILPMHIRHRDPSFINEEVRHRTEIYHLPFIKEEDSKYLFPPCQYNPSYIVKEPLYRYQAMWETHYTSVYPYDFSDIAAGMMDKEKGFISFGNDKMNEDEAKHVVSQVWRQIESKHPGKYSFKKILNVEQNHDQGTGDRYLVELELREISGGKHVRFSEYVYRPWDTHVLCTPEGVTWNKSAVINILLTIGNKQGSWILHFLNYMSKIFKKTNDSNFNIVVTEFDGVDIDMKEALKKSGIPHYQHLRLREGFKKAWGLQLAANMVTNPNSILFVMDLHLDIPNHFLDDVRKHCVQGKIAYSPLLIRLSCGATAHRPVGFWEFYGYGLMGMYKSDWDRIGGMNVKEFKNKWGGEDWEICDRILMDGMEIERLKMVHLFHYFHTKKGMWSDASHHNEKSDSTDRYWQ